MGNFLGVNFGAIHHLASSGGTQITRELRSRANILLFNEFNPFEFQPGTFSPTDLLELLSAEMKVPDGIVAKNFRFQLGEILRMKAQVRNILFRVHSHGDYFRDYREPKTRHLLSELRPAEVVTVREPVRNYFSAKSRGMIGGTLQKYLETYSIFFHDHEDLPLFRFEEFHQNRVGIGLDILAALGFPGRRKALDFSALPRISGDNRAPDPLPVQKYILKQNDYLDSLLSDPHSRAEIQESQRMIESLRSLLGYPLSGEIKEIHRPGTSH